MMSGHTTLENDMRPWDSLPLISLTIAMLALVVALVTILGELQRVNDSPAFTCEPGSTYTVKECP